jgi:putative transposase
VVAGANVNDHKLLRATIESVVVERPSGRQHLCLDKGYDNGEGETQALINGYIPHIRRIGEEKLDGRGRKSGKARRWVVERTFAWLSKCRALLTRYEKKARNYLGLLQLACMLLWYRRYHRLTVLG